MKILALLFCLLASLFVEAQTLPTDPETKKITFQETVIVDSLTKDVLYERSKEWITQNCGSNKMDIDDKVNGKIMKEAYFMIKLTYDFKYKSDNNVTYELSIYQKDGKYKYLLTNFYIYDVKNGPKSAQPLEAYFAKMKQQSKGEFIREVTAGATGVAESIKQYMITGKKKETSEW